MSEKFYMNSLLCGVYFFFFYTSDQFLKVKVIIIKVHVIFY